MGRIFERRALHSAADGAGSVSGGVQNVGRRSQQQQQQQQQQRQSDGRQESQVGGSATRLHAAVARRLEEIDADGRRRAPVDGGGKRRRFATTGCQRRAVR